MIVRDAVWCSRALRQSRTVEDAVLKPADGSQMGISEMAVILMSLGVAPAKVKVAELFCRNKFGDAAVDMGFGATGWDMDDEHMEEVERRVRDEEPVLLIGSPMCRVVSTLIELTRATCNLGRCARHLRFCFRMYETQRSARRQFLHEHPWDAWSRGVSFVKERAEKDGVYKTQGDL